MVNCSKIRTGIRFLALSFLLLLLTGCGSILPGSSTPVPQLTPANTAGLQPSPPVVTAASTLVSTPSGPLTLQVWLPPQFDPNSDTPAGQLLKSRLDEFSKRRPDVRVEVRIKAAEGPGGLLDSMTTASAAAPLALPDLVALPRPILEIAALKGLLHPFDEKTEVLDEADWFDYARQLARLQNSTFGLPFAGDAMILVYRPTVLRTPPADWKAAVSAKTPLAFPAADPQALFSLTLYQSAGGKVRDDQGRPFLDADTLVKVLSFYQEAEQAGVMPFWLTQYQSDDQAWEGFQDSRASMVVTWTSRYLSNMLADTAATHVPTSDGTPYTLASGWVWALASPQPERQQSAAELAVFLTESDFLTQWTEAAGYLPPRPSSLNGWSDTSLQSLVNQIVRSASLYPSEDVLTSLGPPVEQAVLQVLKQQQDPLNAAQAAISDLASP